MSKVTLQEVQELASLAKLALEPSEMKQLQGELSTILDHFEVLSGADTEGVSPMTHVNSALLDSQLRPDRVLESLNAEQVLSASAKTKSESFSVPAVLPSGGNA